MLTKTIGELLGAFEVDAAGAKVYVVRDADFPLYVGMTRRGIAFRLQQHIEARSRIGSLIYEHMPESSAWEVDLYRVDDCRALVSKHFPADRNYVVVNDLLPAGLEPIDPRLQNTDPALRAKLEAERRKALGVEEPLHGDIKRYSVKRRVVGELPYKVGAGTKPQDTGPLILETHEAPQRAGFKEARREQKHPSRLEDRRAQEPGEGRTVLTRRKRCVAARSIAAVLERV